MEDVGLSDLQINKLQIICSFSASLSLIGTSLVLLRGFRRWKKKKDSNIFRKAAWCLAVLDFISAAFEIAGPAGYTDTQFCIAQGFGIQLFVLASVLWHPVFVFLMYAWIVQRNEHSSLDKLLLPLFFGVLICCTIIAVGLAASNSFGPAAIWCWIRPENSRLRFYCFYLPVVICWLVSIAMSLRIMNDLGRRLDGGNASSIVTVQDKMARKAIQTKLGAYIMVFVIIWLIALLNRLIEELAPNTHIFATNALHLSLVPLQGFLNSIIYGGLIGYIIKTIKKKHRRKTFFSSRARSSVGRKMSFTQTRKKLSTLTLSDLHTMLEEGDNKRIELKTTKSRKLSIRELLQMTRKEKSIFITTFNMGESSVETLGDLARWIPKGHNLYVIGLQEALQVDAIRKKIHVHLGLKEWTIFKNDIGSSKTELGFHGFISLSVFARVEDVETGVFCTTETANRKVHQGVKVGVTRAGNKGAVGLPFRYYDTTLAFITAHFASDSKGRKRLQRRNRNARQVLQDTILTEDKTGFDAQLQHHHVVLMGDLNYRLDFGEFGEIIDPIGDALQMVASAATAEKALENDSPNWRYLRYEQLNPEASDSKSQSCFASPRSRIFSMVSSHSRHQSFRQSLETVPWTGEFDSTKSETEAKGNLMLWDGDWNGDETGALMKKAQKRWEELLYHEELTQAIKSKEILYGFEEQRIAFPPSFRRKRGAEGECGDYTNLELLKKAYSTHVQDETTKKTSLRVPSYTDRILVHTLENRKAHIQLGAYEVCDAVTCSDHRPVSLVMKLNVDPKVIPGDLAYLGLKKASLSDSFNKRLSVIQYGREELYCVRLNNFKVDLKLDSTLLIDDPDDIDIDTSNATKASDSSFDVDMTPAYIVTMFPLPAEDPLASKRKVHSVATAIGGSAVNKVSLLRSKSQSQALTITLAELMNNTETIPWHMACRTGINLFADARAAVGLHVLIKIQNALKQTLGQGVICLTDPNGELQNNEEASISLTKAGAYVGTLTCSHKVQQMYGIMP